MLEKLYYARALVVRLAVPFVWVLAFAALYITSALIGVGFLAYVIGTAVLLITALKKWGVIGKKVVGFFKAASAFVVTSFHKAVTFIKREYVTVTEAAKADARYALALKDYKTKIEHRALLALTLENDKNDVIALKEALVAAENKVVKTEKRIVEADNAVIDAADALITASDRRK